MNTKIWRIGTFILIVATLAFIFGNSLQPVEDSRNESQTILNFTQPMLEVIVGVGNVTDHLVRKMAHFTEFFTIGFEFMLFSILRKRRGLQQFANCLSIGLAVAVTDESLQMLTPGRGPLISDVLLDFCGVFTGVLIMLLIYLMLQKRKNL